MYWGDGRQERCEDQKTQQEKESSEHLTDWPESSGESRFATVLQYALVMGNHMLQLLVKTRLPPMPALFIIAKKWK